MSEGTPESDGGRNPARERPFVPRVVNTIRVREVAVFAADEEIRRVAASVQDEMPVGGQSLDELGMHALPVLAGMPEWARSDEPAHGGWSEGQSKGAVLPKLEALR